MQLSWWNRDTAPLLPSPRCSAAWNLLFLPIRADASFGANLQSVNVANLQSQDMNSNHPSQGPHFALALDAFRYRIIRPSGLLTDQSSSEQS